MSTIMEREAPMDTTMTKHAVVSITTGKKTAMSIIMTENVAVNITTGKKTAMSTIMTENAAVATTMLIMTTITITRTKSSQAGAVRLPKLIRKRKSARSWRPFPMMRSTA